ncbi:MAG: hypothetical protein ACLQGP_22300 [Isosphaeraceae bacterium]
MSEMNSDAPANAMKTDADRVEAEPAEPVLSAGDDDPAGSARKPPKELGVMLVSAGVIGVVLPGAGVPAELGACATAGPA